MDKITLETSGEDEEWIKLHSRRVKKMEIYIPNEMDIYTLETGGEDGNLHSKRVEKIKKRSTCPGPVMRRGIWMLSKTQSLKSDSPP